MKTTLGIDLGTQSVKVLFYDFEQRNTVYTASCELEIDQNSDGKAEQQASWWIEALCDALNQVPKQIRESAIAISVSGQQHGFVGLDANGKVIAPVKLWCDTSTQAECDQIMQTLGGEQSCLEISGNKILPGFTASKVLSLKNNQPAVYANLHSILLPHDYINYWLSNQLCMEMGDASGTGFLNVTERRWSKQVLQAIDSTRDLSACLPEPRSGNAVIGRLNAGAAMLTGLNKDTPVAIGGGDNMLGAIGTGNLAPGRTTISLGTSGTVYAYSDHAIIDNNGNISAFCSSNGGWLPLLCTMNCTVSSEVMRSLLDINLSELDAMLNASLPGANGVITLPFFNGERTPNLPNAKACILGLDSLNTRPENLLRSAVEGASFALQFGLNELARVGVHTDEIVLTGGGANSAVWRQMIADITGTEVLVMNDNEGAAFGAALQAYAAYLGQECDHSTLGDHYSLDESQCHSPDSTTHSKYKLVYQQYQCAVDKISELYAGK